MRQPELDPSALDDIVCMEYPDGIPSIYGDVTPEGREATAMRDLTPGATAMLLDGEAAELLVAHDSIAATLRW
jgi:hypothetical protein